MQDGETGSASFWRSDEYGTAREFFISFAPVTTESLKSVLPSDFSRGVHASTKLTYSIGVVIADDDHSAPFEAVEEEVLDDIDRSIAILVSIIAVTAVVVIFMSSWISIAVTWPLILLLKIVQDINGERIHDDIPTLDGGCREVQKVYMSLSSLYRLLRSSNVAFNSGNMMLAYKFLHDALRIFRRAGNQKAIGIAANDLANTLFVMHREKISKRRCREVQSQCVQKMALGLYTEAVDTARMVYESSTQSEGERMLFAAELANRLFNRGLFLSLTTNDVCSPDNALTRGKRDLMAAKDLDGTVRDFLINGHQLQKYSATYFERCVRRARGLIESSRNGISFEEIWNIEEIMEEAESLLFVLRSSENSPLFAEASPIGRLQQLESIALEAESCQGNLSGAANIGMRMLVEDDYIETSAFELAACTLASFLQEVNPPNTDVLRLHLHDLLTSYNIHCRGAVKRVIFAIAQSCGTGRERVAEVFADFYDSSCFDNDLVAFIRSSEAVDDDEEELMRRNSCCFFRKEIVDGGFPLLGDGTPFPSTIIANDGLDRAMKILDSSAVSDLDTWIIVAVGNRPSGSYDALAGHMSTVIAESGGQTFFVIVGVNLAPLTAIAYEEICRGMKNCTYINARDEMETLDVSLGDARALMAGGGKRFCHIPGGITMEQF